MKVFTCVAVTGTIGLVALVGCSSTIDPGEIDGEEPSADVDTAEPNASVVVNGFTLTANKPPLMMMHTGPQAGLIQARGHMTVSGGTGVRPMGVCLLELHRDPGGAARPCSTANDCANITVPAGGFRYCANIDNVGQKYCFARKGTAAALCAGTPVNGVPIGNGTYQTPSTFGAPGVTSWISYACSAGCSTSDPSVSSLLGWL
jgi:hypothetical protein